MHFAHVHERSDVSSLQRCNAAQIAMCLMTTHYVMAMRTITQNVLRKIIGCLLSSRAQVYLKTRRPLTTKPMIRLRAEPRLMTLRANPFSSTISHQSCLVSKNGVQRRSSPSPSLCCRGMIMQNERAHPFCADRRDNHWQPQAHCLALQRHKVDSRLLVERNA